MPCWSVETVSSFIGIAVSTNRRKIADETALGGMYKPSGMVGFGSWLCEKKTSDDPIRNSFYKLAYRP